MIYNLSEADLSISEHSTKKRKIEHILQDECVSKCLISNCREMLTLFSDKGIILHGQVGDRIKPVQAVLDCIYSCLFTRYGLDIGTEEEQKRFRTLFPKEVEM